MSSPSQVNLKLTTINLPPPLRARIDAYGTSTGQSMASLLRAAVVEFLDRREPQAPKEAADVK
jgi:hypothetical protein